MVALFAGGGVASAGMAWCEIGCPPPMEAGLVANPGHNPHGMPTPQYENANGKFVTFTDSQGNTVHLPPGVGKKAE